MRDDVSAIVTNGCSVLTNDYTIQNYSPDHYTRRTYILHSGRWYLQRTETRNYVFDTTGYNCLTAADVSNLNSYSYLEPIFNFISFSLVAIVIYLFFKLIRGFLYAFSR